MARPREFDEMVALEQALQVFWDKGYEATSLSDLTKAMQISKSSFYDTFTSKHDLFLSCLDRYAESNMESVWAVIKNSPSARQSIRSIFQFVIDVVVNDEDFRGCMLSNCAMEFGQHDQEVEKRFVNGFESFLGAFAFALQQGIDNGEFTEIKDVNSVARYLISSLNGLRISALANQRRDQLEGIVDLTLSNIR